MHFTNLSVRLCKKRAKEILKQHDIVLWFFSLSAIGFFAICGISYLIEHVFGLLSSFLETENKYFWYCFSCLCATLVTVSLLSPLWEGMLSYINLLIQKRKVDGHTVLTFYRDASCYRYAWLRGMGRFLHFFVALFLMVALLTAGTAVSSYLIDNADIVRGTLVLGLTLLFFVVLLILFLLFSSDFFLMSAAFSYAPALGYSRIHAISACGMRHQKKRLFLLNLSFLPWFIACVFTLGLALIFVFPYFIVSRAVLATALLDE